MLSDYTLVMMMTSIGFFHAVWGEPSATVYAGNAKDMAFRVTDSPDGQ
jgi:hypothetical protein